MPLVGASYQTNRPSKSVSASQSSVPLKALAGPDGGPRHGPPLGVDHSALDRPVPGQPNDLRRRIRPHDNLPGRRRESRGHDRHDRRGPERIEAAAGLELAVLVRREPQEHPFPLRHRDHDGRPRDRTPKRAQDGAGDGKAGLHDLLDRKRAGLVGPRFEAR